MLTIQPNASIYLHTSPTDLRKSFDGLCALVRSGLQRDPLDGSWFLFLNRRRDRIKIMYWDRDGLALWYKRLEIGSFEAVSGPGSSVLIDATQLAMLLGGVPLTAATKRRSRYRLSTPSVATAVTDA